ncbi:MAG: biotin--[acetyl-CoA-carboxylase] ligase [Bacilli bacterium]
MHDYNIIKFKTISSTNTYLKDNFESLPEFTVVTSDIQTGGKGRMGREWQSDEGNLYFSILLKNSVNKIKKNSISAITLIVGLAVTKVLNEYTSCMIKWPNDVLVGNRKICGILCEAISYDKVKALVIGVGLNLNQTTFSNEIKSKAISLKNIINKDSDKINILSKILKQFDLEYAKFCKGDKGYIAQLNKFSYLNNKNAYIKGENVKILGIDDNGLLKVEARDGVKLVTSGEVTLTDTYEVTK